MQRARRTLILAVVLSLASLAGCTGSTEPQPLVTGAGSVDLAPFLSQSVAWEPCPDSDRFLDDIPEDAQCTTVQVPVDYFADSGRGTIGIALIRIPAQGASQGSLLVNPGGPGGSGFDTVAQSAVELQRNLPGYDIVGFDPRGVARSAGFDCKQSERTRLDTIEADFTPEDASEFDRVYTISRNYENSCREAYPDWGFLGTSSVARDLAVISKALGDEGINYYGISYGSVIGYELLRTYPDAINRMILESVVDPAAQEPLADQLAAFNAQLEDLLAQCATPKYRACGQGRSPEQVRDAFLAAARNVESSDVATLTDNGAASEQLLYHGIVLPLYSEMDESLRELYIEAIAGFINDQDARQFEFWGYLYNSYDYNESSFTASDDIQQLVQCLDESAAPADLDIAQERAKDQAEIADIQQRAPLLAAVAFSDVYDADDRAYETCSYAQGAYEDPGIPDPLAEAAQVTNVGGVPVLVLAVTGDTATPYEWGQTIATRLEVPLVTQNTTGHGVYSQTDNRCTIDVVSNYLATGALPPQPVTC